MAKQSSLRDHPGLKMIIKGIVLSYIITIPVFIIFAFILSNTDFPEKMVEAVVITTTIISVLVAGSSVTKNLKNKGWLNGGLVGLIYMVLLYLFSGIVFRDFSINKYIITVVVIGIITGAIGGILGINLRRSTHARIKASH